MHTGTASFAVVVAGLIGSAGIAGVAVARAEPALTATVLVPVVGPGGRPVFCGANHTGGRATPQDGGGYLVVGLAAGQHDIHLELTDERIDVLVTVTAGQDVVVPPVVVRGPCRDLSLPAPLIELAPRAELPAWTLRIGRHYQAQPGMKPAVFARDRGLINVGAQRAAQLRADRATRNRRD